jgi:hypothetical protein
MIVLFSSITLLGNTLSKLFTLPSTTWGGGVFTPVVWKIPVPSHLHIFSWLLTNNKVLTRDNLAKRKNVDDMRCFFCDEPESVKHLFILSVV